MFHIKNQVAQEKMLVFCMFIIVCAMSFSCAKKPVGVRAKMTKSEVVNMNPVVSNQSEQQAQAQNLIYKIATVSTPNKTDAGFTVNLDLQNPDRQYLPVTTRHENGNMYSEGSFTDSARGAKVYVQAECFGADCFKYLLLVTVVKNNQTVYQTAALSFKCDTTFYSISVAQGVAQFFRSMDEVNAYVESKNYSTNNDCALEE